MRIRNNFWKTLPSPFFCLAPMAEVTDAAFRRVIAKYGKPDVMWTEFVSADGLVSAGRANLEKDLAYGEDERPIVAQLFTSDPGHMREAAAIIAELGFDGVDINMGCPDKAVEKQGAGADIIKHPKLAPKLIQAAKEGAASAGWRMPVSVKTRLGYKTNEVDTWLPTLLAAEPAAITLHLRTRKELSDVPARWEEAKEARAIRDKLGSKTLLIGNGDVNSLAEGRARAASAGFDGVMVGRGVFGNPWFFNPDKQNISPEEKLLVLIEHARLYEQFVSHKGFHVMKKHVKAYVAGWNGAKELRIKLMDTNSADEMENVIKKFA